MLSKALHEDNFGHELQQMLSFFSSDLNKFKTQNPTENFESYHIVVDEKQAGIKDDIRITSSLSEVLKLVKLILTLYIYLLDDL